MSSVKRKSSRRKFLALLAAGTVAVATSPVSTIAATQKKPATTTRGRTKSTTAPVKARVTPFEAEIERQKKDVAKTLKLIRDYQLAPGTEPAFVFTPMKALAKRRSS